MILISLKGSELNIAHTQTCVYVWVSETMNDDVDYNNVRYIPIDSTHLDSRLSMGQLNGFEWMMSVDPMMTMRTLNIART